VGAAPGRKVELARLTGDVIAHEVLDERLDRVPRQQPAEELRLRVHHRRRRGLAVRTLLLGGAGCYAAWPRRRPQATVTDVRLERTAA
jgi:hypothetical protein